MKQRSDQVEGLAVCDGFGVDSAQIPFFDAEGIRNVPLTAELDSVFCVLFICVQTVLCVDLEEITCLCPRLLSEANTMSWPLSPTANKIIDIDLVYLKMKRWYLT